MHKIKIFDEKSLEHLNTKFCAPTSTKVRKYVKYTHNYSFGMKKPTTKNWNFLHEKCKH